tara:strand:+ start:1128 stop:2276 length:1149 start_codon:yes stop_codon:yes gene_type:complete
MRNFIILFVIFFGILNAQDRVITTGVPFLMISPDARAAGMGELGVATSADAYSQQWNPAKYIFSISERGLALSYTPYLSKLVDDIFLGNLNYYKHLNDRSAWAFSLKYFSLGDIQFNELIGGSIIDQGLERPNELTLDLSYSLKLSPFFSMGIAGRYIRSDLKITSESGSKSANSLGVDVSAFYQGQEFQFTNNNKGLFRFGINISNVGPRLNYDVGGQKNFIPSNLKFGTGLDLILDSSNIFGIYLEFNKLLVPSPVSSYSELGIFQGYKQPDISFLKGILTSFTDAEDGFKEEFQEITYAIGLEYKFAESFSIRTGYFNENENKGSRKYLTMGTGFNLGFIEMDISYLFSTSKVRNPLENTIRFSTTFKLENKQVVDDPN